MTPDELYPVACRPFFASAIIKCVAGLILLAFFALIVAVIGAVGWLLSGWW